MPPLGTYRLRVPASRVLYVPDAQGGLPPGPHVLYVLGTRTSLGRTVRTAYRGNPGADCGPRWLPTPCEIEMDLVTLALALALAQALALALALTL